MELSEIHSAKQMEAALDEGDSELERQIERAVARKVQGSWETATYEFEHLEGTEVAAMVEDPLDIIGQFRDSDRIEELLAPLPPQTVLAALQEEVDLAAERATTVQRGRRGAPGSNMLTFATGQGPGLSLRPVYAEYYVTFDEPLSWVPPERMVELLNAELQGAEWELRDNLIDESSYSSGWTETGDMWRLEVDVWTGHEWAVDLRTTYFSELVDAAPEEAVRAFLEILKREYPELARKVKKAKFPKDILADYAVAYFEDPDSGIEVINQAVGEFGYAGTRGDVLLELDKAALRELGIAEGRWWDGAPWKLVNLPVEELLYEGTLMRHCVGRHNMGYAEAVRRGETQIWSLRSRYNKPVLTFEVDAHEWASPSPLTRGQAIEQLKGKLNRSAGGDADEARVLFWIFAKLGINPRFVRDFVGEWPPETNPGFNCPWRPYDSRRRDRLLAF